MAEPIISCGYVPDGEPLASAYLVNINAMNPYGGAESGLYSITAALQDSFKIGVSNNWQNAFAGGMWSVDPGNSTINTIAGGLFGATVQSKLFTRRVWTGTNPTSIPLKLKFNAVNNAYNEVLLPCVLLYALASPYSVGGMLLPPGPFPTDTLMNGKVKAGIEQAAGSLESSISSWRPIKAAIDKIKKEFSDENTAKEKVNELLAPFKEVLKQIWNDIGRANQIDISIQIGNMATFSRVLILDFNMMTEVKFDPNGLPVSAECSLTFQPWEVITRNDILGSGGGRPMFASGKSWFAGQTTPAMRVIR